MAIINLPSLSREWVIETTTNRFTKAWGRFFNDLWQKTGGGVDTKLPWQLSIDTTAVNNVDAGEDDLITYTLPANTLNEVNDVLDVKAFGIFDANANSKNVKLKIGASTVFDTGAAAFNDKAWYIHALFIRVDSTTIKAIVNFAGDTALTTTTAEYSEPTVDLTVDAIIKCTGEAVATGDIVQEGLIINAIKGF